MTRQSSRFKPNALELEVQQHWSNSEVQSQSSNPEVQFQSSDPEDSSTASSRLSLCEQISSDGSVADDTPPNYDELQNLDRSSNPRTTVPTSPSRSARMNLLKAKLTQQVNRLRINLTQQLYRLILELTHPDLIQPTDRQDDCSPHSFSAPAGVYANLQAGLAYIAHFKTLDVHQAYLMNIVFEFMFIGRKIENVKKELKKRKDLTDIPRDFLTTENTGKD